MPHASSTPVSRRTPSARGEALGQHPPLGAGLVEVEDGVHHIALGVHRSSAAVVLALKVVFDEAPFFVREVAVVHGS
jgi:hypothetical protein